MGSSQTWDGTCFPLHWQVNYCSVYHQGNPKFKKYIEREQGKGDVVLGVSSDRQVTGRCH